MGDWLTSFLTPGAIWPYPAAFITLVLAGLGLPIPEEVTFLTAGAVTQQVDGSMWWMIAMVVSGVLIGDILTYFAGRRWGKGLLQNRLFSRVVTPERLKKGEAFFEKHGIKAVFAGGLVAGLRAPTFFLAGTMRVPFWAFVTLDGCRATLTGGVSVWAAYTLGDAAGAWVHEHQQPVFIGIGILVLGWLGMALWKRRKKEQTGG